MVPLNYLCKGCTILKSFVYLNEIIYDFMIDFPRPDPIIVKKIYISRLWTDE